MASKQRTKVENFCYEPSVLFRTLDRSDFCNEKKMDRKYSKDTNRRASRPKKRRFCGNKYTLENETEFASTSAEKLKKTEDKEIIIDQTHSYRILQFFSVFSSISELVVCKICKEEVKFSETSAIGLGFRIAIECTNCGITYVNSCPKINHSYEINRRLVIVMRLLGIGKEGIDLFCGLMDIVNEFYSKIYYAALENTHCASKAVYELLANNAIEEEKEKNLDAENTRIDLTVSDGGTWKKIGVTYLFGVTSLIGKYTNKVIDLVVNSSYCKPCDCESNVIQEYELDWTEVHKDECLKNRTKTIKKMEIDAIIEMFQRSEEQYGVRYANYIGDGSNKTFEGILAGKPYGDAIELKKKESVEHVGKIMGRRLREVRKENRGIEEKGKLTDKLIRDLSTYYQLAIRENSSSVEEMEKAIWATFHHKFSSDKDPRHMNCPSGSKSWCKWRRAEAEGKLQNFTHDVPMNKEIEEKLKPIYEELTSRELLERCLGGNVRNDNESLNELIWHFCPKNIYCGSKTIQISAFLAAGIFNGGYSAILKVMQTMGITIGPIAKIFADHKDSQRVQIADKRHYDSSKKARAARWNEQATLNEFYEEEEGLLYGPKIAD